MRRQFLCLPEEYSCFLKSSFSAVHVETWQGYAGVKIYPKYVPIKHIRKKYCFYRLSRAFFFFFLLFTFLEELMCTERAVLQACKGAEQDCPHTPMYNCDAGHRNFP